MQELRVDSLFTRQQEILRAAKRVEEREPRVTIEKIALEAEGYATPESIKRTRLIIDTLKKMAAWPYNKNGLPGFTYLNHKLIYDESALARNGEATQEPAITTPAPEANKLEWMDIQSTDKPEQQHNKEFVEDLLEIFFLLPEPSQNRLWPSVASLISRVIEPHN